MLSYTESGSGFPIVLLHAFPLNKAMWQPQIETWQSWGRVIAMDLPGFGDSPRQATPSIPDMACEVVHTLKACGVEGPAIFAGLSMGGYVSFEIYRQFPEKVKALGLFATRAASDTPEQVQVRKMSIAAIKSQGLAEYAKIFLSKCVTAQTRSEKPDLVKSIESMIISGSSLDGIVDAMEAMMVRRDSREWLSTVDCPVLVVGGAEDALIPQVEAQHMAQAMPHAQWALIQDAGHLLNLEQPASLDAFWANFLDKACGIQLNQQ